MATYTPNLNLKKPAGSDYVLVNDFNTNSDKLDGVIGKISQLETVEKSNLVFAINEAAKRGGENAPYIDKKTSRWMEWDFETQKYIDTGIEARGPMGPVGPGAGFGVPSASAVTLDYSEPPTAYVTASGDNKEKIFAFRFGIPQGKPGVGLRLLGQRESLEQLQQEFPNPEIGDAYGIGASPPYDIYIYGVNGWMNFGSFQVETVLLGTVQVPKKLQMYPICTLYISYWAYGMGGAGLGPAGGGITEQVIGSVAYNGRDVKVYAPSQYADYVNMGKVNDTSYAFFKDDASNTKSMYFQMK